MRTSVLIFAVLVSVTAWANPKIKHKTCEILFVDDVGSNLDWSIAQRILDKKGYLIHFVARETFSDSIQNGSLVGRYEVGTKVESGLVVDTNVCDVSFSLTWYKEKWDNFREFYGHGRETDWNNYRVFECDDAIEDAMEAIPECEMAE
ncbi:MAG: hypothetical protein AB7F43_11475 [Bacteriovoracia bacterium]